MKEILIVILVLILVGCASQKSLQTQKWTVKMNYAIELFKIIDENFEKNQSNNFHNLLGSMISSIQDGRINVAKEHSDKINNYFYNSPDVYEKVKEYKPKKMLKFLNKIIQNWQITNNSKVISGKYAI